MYKKRARYYVKCMSNLIITAVTVDRNRNAAKKLLENTKHCKTPSPIRIGFNI